MRMIGLDSEYVLPRVIDAAFMIAAAGLASNTGYTLLASIFGAKALLSIILATSSYRRHRKMRFQLQEHLHQADVETRDKRP